MTALIAARPTRALRQQLRKAYSKDLWVHLPLATLSLEESRQYFQASKHGDEIDEDMVERIWLLSDGRCRPSRAISQTLSCPMRR